MQKWIARLLEDSPIEIPEGVPEAWVQRLEGLLAPLDKLNSPHVRAGIAKDILSHVLHGRPTSVLTEVGNGEVIGQQLCMLGYTAHRASDLPDVYEHFNEVPPPIALRWAYFLTACVSLRLATQFSPQPRSNV